MRISIRFLLLAQAAAHAVSRDEGIFMKDDEKLLATIVQGSEEEEQQQQRRLDVVDLPPYEGEIDVMESPVTVSGSLDCIPTTQYFGPDRADEASIYEFPDRWDYYQLNLKADYCYTITVNRIDCDMPEAFGVYKGMATIGNSPASTSDPPIIDAVEVVRETKQIDWSPFRTGSEYCEDYDVRTRLAPVQEDGPYTLAVWYDGTVCSDQGQIFGCGSDAPLCDGTYEYEISIQPEKCPAGKVTYQGEIDVVQENDDGPSITTINASIPCTTPSSEDIQSVPEFWQLWQVDVLAGNCLTFVLNRVSCGMLPSLSLYKGIAEGAISGASSSDPDALVGATLVGWANRTSTGQVRDHPLKYCPFQENFLEPRLEVKRTDPLLEFKDPSYEGEVTLAVHYSENPDLPCVDDSYEYEIEVRSRPCVALRETCLTNEGCASNLCTGRPGNTKKCRACARKKEVCTADEECCQSQNMPGRYCSNGQCNKRPFPLLLALDRDGHYYWVDTATGKRRVMVMDEVLQTSITLFFGNEEIEYDPTTGTLYGMDFLGTLYKIDPLQGSVLEEISPTGCSDRCILDGMEFVDGTLYGTERGNRNGDGGDPILVTVDTTSGAYTAIGPIEGLREGFTAVAGLAHDGSTMYGLATSVRDDSISDLITIDLNTALVKSSVPLVHSETKEPLREIKSIEFGANGVLYAGLSRFGTTKDYAGLGTVDMATGEVTLFQELGDTTTALTLAY